MDSLTKKPARKRLSELLVEAGIVKPEELPKGLEYAQKATDEDVQAVQQVKELIEVQGLSVPTALRALVLAKQKHCSIEVALTELGWRPRVPKGYEGEAAAARQIKSQFNPSDLEGIGGANVPGKSGPTYSTDLQRNTWTGLKARSTQEHELKAKFLKGEPGGDGEAPNAVQRNPYIDSIHSAETTEIPFNLEREQEDWGLRDSHLGEISTPLVETTLAPDGETGGGHGETQELDAYSPEFVTQMRVGDQLFAEHRYAEAEAQYAVALEQLERARLNRDLEIADVLVKMGRATLQISEFARAETYLCRALKIREIHLGRNHLSVAECLDYLAETYDLQSQYLEAEQYYLGSLGIKERILNPDNSEVARSLKKLVAVSKRRTPHAEEKLAGELLTEAGLVDTSKLQEGLLLAQEKLLPIGRALISLNYLTDQDLEAVVQAQLLLREGILPAYLGVRALRIASQKRITLEKALREIGLEPDDANYQAVFALLRAAHELLSAERQLDPADPGLGMLCVKVGDVYTDHQRYKQAENLYRRALSIRQRQEDVEQKDIAEILARIGDLLFRQQRFDDALDLYIKLLDLWEAEVGTDDINFVNCLESLAAVHYVKGDFKEAGRMYQLAVTGKERLLGQEHPAVASAIQGRANCYFAIQRYPEAEDLYRRAADMYEHVYGPDSEQVGALLNVLGDLFYTQGQYDKAQVEYAKGLDAFSKCNNPDVWAFTSMLEKSAYCFAEAGDYERADAYYRHFFQTRESLGSFHAPDIPEALERFAIVLERMGRQQEAESMREHADTTRRTLNII